MNLVICENYEDASKYVADIICNSIKLNPNLNLGLATGSTPIGVYNKMIEYYNRGLVNYSNIKTFNLDEYIGVKKDSPNSYYTFMNENLFNYINVKRENIHIPDNSINDLNNCSIKYNQLLKDNVIDIQLLGIGLNGHIGFNEPGTTFDQEVSIVELTQSTIDANKRFFNSIDEVPKYAITIGIKNILSAKKIILMACGKEKADIVKKLFCNEISLDIPASSLKLHDDVLIIIDKQAAKYILKDNIKLY